MSVRSIIPALFFPRYAPRPAPTAVQMCAQELSALEQELATRASEHLAQRKVRGMQRWLSAWDQRYLALSGGCGPLDHARVELGVVRTEIESLLQRYSRRTGAAQQRIHRALERLHSGGDELSGKS